MVRRFSGPWVTVAALLSVAAPEARAARKPAAPPPPPRIEKLARALALEDARVGGAGELEALVREVSVDVLSTRYLDASVPWVCFLAPMNSARDDQA